MSIMLRLSAFALFLVATLLFTSSLKIGLTSAQNANSSTQNANSSATNRNQNDSTSVAPGAQQDFSKNTWELPADADKTPNPVPSSPESIEKGKALYMERTKGNCIFCHGETGAGNEANF